MRGAQLSGWAGRSAVKMHPGAQRAEARVRSQPTEARLEVQVAGQAWVVNLDGFGDPLADPVAILKTTVEPSQV